MSATCVSGNSTGLVSMTLIIPQRKLKEVKEYLQSFKEYLQSFYVTRKVAKLKIQQLAGKLTWISQCIVHAPPH